VAASLAAGDSRTEEVMTYRTTRDAFGVSLTREAFEPDTDPDRPVIIGSLLLAAVFAGLWGAGLLTDRWSDVHDLRQHNCVYVNTLAGDGDTVLWHCRDGYRVSSARFVDGH
jgi:hypothetical protein